MSDLNGAIFYATMRGIGDLTFDSVGQRKDTIASFALRCSMSIPLVFIPESVDGRRVFDGGLRSNFSYNSIFDGFSQYTLCRSLSERKESQEPPLVGR